MRAAAAGGLEGPHAHRHVTGGKEDDIDYDDTERDDHRSAETDTMEAATTHRLLLWKYEHYARRLD